MATVTASFGLAHKNAKPVDNQSMVKWLALPEKKEVDLAIKWGNVQMVDNTLAIAYGGFTDRDKQTKTGWDKLVRINRSINIGYGGLLAIDRGTRSDFTDFTAHYDRSNRIVWRRSIPHKDVTTHGYWAKFTRWDRQYLAPWSNPDNIERQTTLPWDKVWTGKRDVAIDTNPVIPPILFEPETNEIQQVYFIMHAIDVVVLPARTAINVTSLSLSLDIDAFAWLMNMQVIGDIDLIRPDVSGVKEIEINIDGYIWVLIVESYTENKELGNNSWSVTGRSKTAYLTAPYKIPISNTYTSDILAAQIVNNELLGSGFTANYNTVDWLVTASAFSYQNLTTMQVIKRVANAIGGVVLPHQSDSSLKINARYQSSPWDWGTATPVASLTSDVILKMSGNWQPKADINGVYVGGSSVGVSCFVKRLGSAGDQLAQQYLDDLLTHQNAGREKGRNILSDRGKQEVINIELPILPVGQAPGIYQCGDLIEIDEGGGNIWRGIILSIAISVQSSATELIVTQNLSIERHYGEY